MKIKGHKAEIISHLFQTLLITYLILLLIEQIYTGFVSTYLNLNYLLILTIAAGILDVFTVKKKVKEKTKKSDYYLIYALGILGAIIIKYKTADLNYLSYIISIIAGILIILLSYLILEEDEK
ncbi:hypothetical protein K8R33_03365 [archaeon]|nr:hypothetical protein [archaeon]